VKARGANNEPPQLPVVAGDGAVTIIEALLERVATGENETLSTSILLSLSLSLD